MTEFPHIYRVSSSVHGDDNLQLTSTGLAPLPAAAPAEFNGPGDQWSPETLLMASVSSCFILSFRAIASASRLAWEGIHCDVEGTLNKVERTIKFTDITLNVKLTIPAEVSGEKAEKLLHKAEQSCLISNSLNCTVHLHCEVSVA